MQKYLNSNIFANCTISEYKYDVLRKGHEMACYGRISVVPIHYQIMVPRAQAGGREGKGREGEGRREGWGGKRGEVREERGGRK